MNIFKRKHNNQEPGLTTSRIEALTDGIFAIAMTLLILNIDVPVVPKEDADIMLIQSIEDYGHDFLHYFLSFILLATFWVMHHKQYHFIRKINRKMLWVNLVMLMFVSLLPFSASLISDYTDSYISTIFFESNLFILTLILYLNWKYATLDKLIEPDLNPEFIKRANMIYLYMIIISILALLLTLLSPRWSITIYILIPILNIRYNKIHDEYLGESLDPTSER